MDLYTLYMEGAEVLHALCCIAAFLKPGTDDNLDYRYPNAAHRNSLVDFFCLLCTVVSARTYHAFIIGSWYQKSKRPCGTMGSLSWSLSTKRTPRRPPLDHPHLQRAQVSHHQGLHARRIGLGAFS